MLGIILIGHGEFANGLSSALELIAGQQSNFANVNFLKNMSSRELENDVKQHLSRFEHLTGTLIISDLKGGTPYKVAKELAIGNDKIEVVTGVNLAMLIEATMMLVSVSDLKNFALSLVETGQGQVEYFDKSELGY